MTERPDPYASLSVERMEHDWNEAGRIASHLAREGWLCGHPDRGDVEVALRMALNSGYLVLPKASAGSGDGS